MSWSYGKLGKPQEVAADAAVQLALVKCHEPEETIKSKVAEIIAVSLAVFPEDKEVSVRASGSQSFVDYDDHSKGAINSPFIEIKPA